MLRAAPRVAITQIHLVQREEPIDQRSDRLWTDDGEAQPAPPISGVAGSSAASTTGPSSRTAARQKFVRAVWQLQPRRDAAQKRSSEPVRDRPHRPVAGMAA